MCVCVGKASAEQLWGANHQNQEAHRNGPRGHLRFMADKHPPPERSLFGETCRASGQGGMSTQSPGRDDAHEMTPDNVESC